MAGVTIQQRREPAAARVWLRITQELYSSVPRPKYAVMMAWSEALVLQEGQVANRLRLLDGLNTAYDAAGPPELALATVEAIAAQRQAIARPRRCMVTSSSPRQGCTSTSP